MQLPAPSVAPDIRIELRRGATAITVRWPTEVAAACAAWMRELLDMRAGADRLLARVVDVFSGAQAHHGYLFANARGTRVKLLVHDGFGVWCAVRRLNQGRFVWPGANADTVPALTRAQFDALVLGLPWQRLEHMQVITHV